MGNLEDLEPLARRGDRDFDEEFDRAVVAFRTREAEHRASRSIWLAHHWPDEYDRCVVLGGRHVCRRCLVLYPLALAVAIASLAGMPPWPEALDLWLIWGLCIPASSFRLRFQSKAVQGAGPLAHLSPSNWKPSKIGAQMISSEKPNNGHLLPFLTKSQVPTSR